MKLPEFLKRVKESEFYYSQETVKICLTCKEVLDENLDYCPMCHNHRLLRITIL